MSTHHGTPFVNAPPLPPPVPLSSINVSQAPPPSPSHHATRTTVTSTSIPPTLPKNVSIKIVINSWEEYNRRLTNCKEKIENCFYEYNKVVKKRKLTNCFILFRLEIIIGSDTRIFFFLKKKFNRIFVFTDFFIVNLTKMTNIYLQMFIIRLNKSSFRKLVQ